MNTDKIIPIFFSCDDNYIPFLAVALTSLEQNASKNHLYDIHILHTKTISPANQASILKRFNNQTFRVCFDDITATVEHINDMFVIRDYYSKATYNRLFIANMFPQYDKVLYLDSDVVVKGNIAEMFNIDIGDNLLGATNDEFVAKTPVLHSYILNTIGHSAVKYYLNAGILIMNCKKMREVHFEDKLIATMKQIQFTVAQDQDLLNVICRGKVKFISGLWDKMPFADDTIDENEIKLLHYNLDLKPWQKVGIPYENYFWHYAKLSGSYDEIMKIKASWTPERIEIAKKQTIGIVTAANEQANNAARNAEIKKIVDNIWK